MNEHRRVSMEMAYQIPGMLWPVEQGWLYDAFAKSSEHAELGSYCGRSMFCAASGAEEPMNVVCVDDFRESPVPEWPRRVFQATADMLMDWGPVSIELVRLSTVDAFRMMAEQERSFDSLFIDACHEYAECKADIENWSTLVRPGGLIAGHDYSPRHPGVMDAVNETGAFEVVPETRIWFRLAE